MANEQKPDAIPAYDFLDDTLLRKVNKAVKSAAGPKSEMIVKDHGPISSAFTHTDQGLRCVVCGTVQDAPTVEACQQCGVAYQLTLYVGY